MSPFRKPPHQPDPISRGPLFAPQRACAPCTPPEINRCAPTSWPPACWASCSRRQPATADADSERQARARITHEIEALEPLIYEAESQSVPDARAQFRYDWLRQDLVRMRLGIHEHLDAPRTQPRTFPPLRGNYRR